MTDDELRKLAERHIAGFERIRAGGSIFMEDVAVNTEELARAVLRLLAEKTQPITHPMDRKKKCPACGHMSRVTTAGCDHCDLEDK